MSDAVIEKALIENAAMMTDFQKISRNRSTLRFYRNVFDIPVTPQLLHSYIDLILKRFPLLHHMTIRGGVLLFNKDGAKCHYPSTNTNLFDGIDVIRNPLLNAHNLTHLRELVNNFNELDFTDRLATENVKESTPAISVLTIIEIICKLH